MPHGYSAAPLFAVSIVAMAFAAAPTPNPASPPDPKPAASTVTPSPSPASPPSPVSGIRNKISAGDLLSAESILEVHREKHGADGPWLVGLSWLARGALLLGEDDRAGRYVAEVRREVADRVAKGAAIDKESSLETALGAAIEVAEQQRAARARAFVQAELAAVPGPIALRSRLHKRLAILGLANQPAPELVAEDFLGATAPPALATLAGRPVVLFLWAEWCGDCKAQSAALARVRARYAEQGLEVVALTRFYDPDSARVVEKARVDSMWTAVYSEVGAIPRVFSTASMERYGGSSTPTFVFIDRKGVVRDYTPTRLTEAELEKRVRAIL
jgi:thiol-disulfide isomerase/thioredoxin